MGSAKERVSHHTHTHIGHPLPLNKVWDPGAGQMRMVLGVKQEDWSPIEDQRFSI